MLFYRSMALLLIKLLVILFQHEASIPRGDEHILKILQLQVILQSYGPFTYYVVNHILYKAIFCLSYFLQTTVWNSIKFHMKLLYQDEMCIPSRSYTCKLFYRVMALLLIKLLVISFPHEASIPRDDVHILKILQLHVVLQSCGSFTY